MYITLLKIIFFNTGKKFVMSENMNVVSLVVGSNPKSDVCAERGMWYSFVVYIKSRRDEEGECVFTTFIFPLVASNSFSFFWFKGIMRYSTFILPRIRENYVCIKKTNALILGTWVKGEMVNVRWIWEF